jgi:hypothetical protein
MNHNLKLVISFVLEQADSQPIGRRAKIYRALSETCGEPVEQRQLAKLADDLESIDKACRQFEFSFNQK